MTTEEVADLYTREIMALASDTLRQLVRIAAKLSKDTTTADRAMLTISSVTLMFIKTLAETQQEAELFTMSKMMEDAKR